MEDQICSSDSDQTGCFECICGGMVSTSADHVVPYILVLILTICIGLALGCQQMYLELDAV